MTGISIRKCLERERKLRAKIDELERQKRELLKSLSIERGGARRGLWTAQHVKAAKCLRLAGFSFAAIATILGRTQSAVETKIKEERAKERS